MVGQPDDTPFAFFSTDYDLAGQTVFNGLNEGRVRPGTAMTFYDDSLGASNTTIVGRSWDFGDGGTSTGTNPTHTYASAGRYTVVETVTDSANNHAQYSEVVTVDATPLPPVATAVDSDLSAPRVNQTVTFSAIAFDRDNPPTKADPSSHLTYAWDFGDGGTSTAANPTHAFAAGGSKLVKVTVTDADDGLSAQQATVIVVHATNLPPTPKFTQAPFRPTAGQNVDFNNNSFDVDDPTASLTYTWDFGDGSTSTQASPSHTYTNAGDYFVTLTAADPNGGTAVEGATVQVLPGALVAPANQALPTISGTAQSGSTLTTSNGTWTGSNPITFTYDWFRCDGAGANCVDLGVFNQQYALTGADVGSRLKARVFATNGQGTTSADSMPSAVVVGVAPQNTAAPAITGAAQAGQLLSVTPGTWTGTGAVTLAYQWLRCDNAGAGCAAIPFETGTSYRAAPADEGHALRVRETATDSQGNAFVDSGATAAVAPGAPVNLTGAFLTGAPVRDGSSLTASNGTWAGSQPITFGYQWQRCDDVATPTNCTNIAGSAATLQSYQLTTADVGHRVRAVVTATNGVGNTPSTTGLSTTVAAGVVAPAKTADPSIGGIARDGQTLTETPGTFSGSSPTITHQWQRCDAGGANCADLPGQTGTTYSVVPADVGHTLRVVDTATNTAGQAVGTAVTGVVSAIAPANTAAPSISGATVVGQQLTASPGTWSGTPTITFAYQWQQCDGSGNACADIAGAGAPTYTLAAGDAGHTIRVRVTATNAGGAPSAT
jgi:PKD repeat protein